MPGSTYLRLLRRSDLQVIKDLHGSLFQFDLGVGDYALREAVTNSRWMSLAAVDGDPSGTGPEQLAGFVLSVLGTVSEFEEVDYAAAPGDPPASSDSNPSSGGTSLGLRYLNLHPDDRVINVWLLASLPQYRRKGVGSQLLSQVINSARNAKAKAVFLHVVDDNSPALTFYHKLGFKVMARIPNFYEISNSTAAGGGAQSREAVEAENRDALLLSLAVDEVTVGNIQEASTSFTLASTAQSSSSNSSSGGSNSGSSSIGNSNSSSSTSTRVAQKAAADNTSIAIEQQSFKDAQQQDQQAGGASVLDALTGILGGLFGVQPRGRGSQQRERAGQPVVVNGEQMVMVKGQDGEVYMLPPPDTPSKGAVDAASTTAASRAQGGDTEAAAAASQGASTAGAAASIQGADSAGKHGTEQGSWVQGTDTLQSGEQVHVGSQARDVRSHAIGGWQGVHSYAHDSCSVQCSQAVSYRGQSSAVQGRWLAGIQQPCGRHLRPATQVVRCQASERWTSALPLRQLHSAGLGSHVVAVRLCPSFGRTGACVMQKRLLYC